MYYTKRTPLKPSKQNHKYYPKNTFCIGRISDIICLFNDKISRLCHDYEVIQLNRENISKVTQILIIKS